MFDKKITVDSNELKLWEALEAECGLTQRVIGITRYQWRFVEYQVLGTGTRRKPFELFDEVICGLLLQEDGLSAARMKELLGLDDELGSKAFVRMLEPLIGSMVAGDSSFYSLTEKGRIYAKEGSKYVPFENAYNLIKDLQFPDLLKAHTIFQLWKPAKLNGDHLGNELAFEDLLNFTEKQEPSVHLPEKGFFLDHAQIQGTRIFQAEVSIGIIEDFDEEIEYLYLIDPRTSQINDLYSKRLNQPEYGELRERVCKHFILENQYSVSNQEKSESQLTDEKQQKALKSNLAKLDEAEYREKEKSILKLLDSQRKSFTTLQFERELERIAGVCKNECWFISPWIRKNAFAERKPQIERMLKRGASVMVAFSKPHRSGEEMVESGIIAQLEKWEAEFEGFFFAELPEFHEKILMVELEANERYEYTGSFNILSFSAIGKLKIGRENMRRLAWGEDSQNNYQYFKDQFVKKLEAEFRKEVKNWKDLTNSDKIGKIKERDEFLKFRKGKFSRLGIGEGLIPSWMEVTELQLKAKSKWISDSLNNLNSNWEQKVKAAPQNLGKTSPEIQKVLSTFPDIPRGKFQEQLELAGKWEKTAAVFIQLNSLEKELNAKEESLLFEVKEKFEKRLESIEVEDLPLEGEILKKIDAIKSLIKVKSGTPRLKVVGKIDLSQYEKKHINKK